MATASINIEAMRSAVTALGAAGEEFRGIRTSLSASLSGVGIPSYHPNPLLTAANWCDSAIPDLTRRLALAEELMATQPGFDGTVEIDENDLSSLTPEEAAQAAEELAEAVTNGEDLTDEQLQTLLDNANDPYFATAFANAVDPQTLADYTERLSNQHSSDMDSQNWPYDVDPEEYRQSLIDRYDSILDGLGMTLGTASRSAEPRLRDGYLDEVVTLLTDDPWGPQPMAISELLSRGSFSADFSSAVATAVYDHEREVDTSGYWENLGGGSDAGFVMPGNYRRTDVMAGIMGMLGNSPEGAQAFFSSGPTTEIEVDGQTITVTERMRYLIQSRTWSSRYLSDEGDGLGRALLAATTTFRNRENSGQSSAELATATFALIAEKTKEGADNGFLGTGLGADNGWEMPKEMRQHVAEMLADFSPDMFRVVGDGGSNDDLSQGYSTSDSNFPPGMPYGAVLTDHVLSQLMFTLGQDPAHVTVVGGGWAAANHVYMSHQMQSLLEGNPDAAIAYHQGSLASLDNHAASSAMVLDFLMDAAYVGDADDAAKAAQRAKAYKDILSAASAVPVLKPAELLGDWGGYAFNQSKTRVLDAIGNSGSGRADTGELNTYREDAADGAMQTYLNLLVAHGFYDPEVLERVNAETTGVNLESPADWGLVIVDDEGNHILDVDHPDYQQWLLNHSRSSEIRQAVITAFGLEPR